MTNLKQVREAAERVEPIVNGWDTNELPDGNAQAVMKAWRSDLQTLVNHTKSTIEPDADEAVTEEWLREVWGFEKVYNSEEPDYIFTDEHGQELMKLYRCANVFVCEVPDWPHDIHNRHQFSQIAQALGLKRKGE